MQGSATSGSKIRKGLRKLTRLEFVGMRRPFWHFQCRLVSDGDAAVLTRLRSVKDRVPAQPPKTEEKAKTSTVQGSGMSVEDIDAA